MKLANNVNLRVFCREDEDKEKMLGKMKELLPFDLEKEKIGIAEKRAEGFEDKKITVITTKLSKDRHINAFLENLAEKLGEETKTILEQADSRMDDDLNFFIRLDKELLMKGKFVLTDSGNCYHIRINLAAFTKKREKGMRIAEEIFGKQ